MGSGGRILLVSWGRIHLDAGCLDRFPSCCHHGVESHASQGGLWTGGIGSTRMLEGNTESPGLLNPSLHLRKLRAMIHSRLWKASSWGWGMRLVQASSIHGTAGSFSDA